MFVITQFIGLGVIYAYNKPVEKTIFNETTQQYENITAKPNLPYGMEPPEEVSPREALPSIIIAMVIAIGLVFLLMTLKANNFIRLWFFIVVIVAIALFVNAVFLILNIPSQEINFLGISFTTASIIGIIFAIPLAIYKIFRQNLIVHNITELMIYPGVAAVLVGILDVFTVIILLVLISIYDIYAVWHAGFMQKMAKFQINELKFFTGFFVPYVAKKDRVKLKKARDIKKKTGKGKNPKVKVNLAILGGGDVVFPILAAGVILLSRGFIPAVMVTFFATIALLGLFALSKKGKFYPAMPFISAGIFLGMLVGLLF